MGLRAKPEGPPGSNWKSPDARRSSTRRTELQADFSNILPKSAPQAHPESTSEPRNSEHAGGLRSGMAGPSEGGHRA
eukprot:2654490-Alexandrium_andersonii.AAC.1